MPDAPLPADDPQLAAAYQAARTELHDYISRIEAAHREQYPDPPGRDGKPRWHEEQAAHRTAAWTEDQNAEVARLREAERAAVLALHRARQAEPNY